jgi:hypothetical protein
MGTLINPGRPSPQAEQDFTTEPVYLRNPQTGIIFKLTHIDTIKRCQSENYLPSSEEAMLEQAQEMYAVQGRVWPPRPAEPQPGNEDSLERGFVLGRQTARAALRSK